MSMLRAPTISSSQWPKISGLQCSRNEPAGQVLTTLGGPQVLGRRTN